MRIRLLRKLAPRLNGIDVSLHHVGDILELPPYQAELLIAEGWASPVRNQGDEAPEDDREPDNVAR
jgi:hypothetical protein